MKASSARVPQKKPKLGQHFLTDTVATIRIVEALGDLSRATVLEIGPGRGVLTSLLVRRARRIIAVETDRVLAAQLRMKFSLTPNVEIIEGDILAVDFQTLFGPKPGSTRPGMEQAPEKVKVIGNIPYFITSEILLRLFEHRTFFDMFVLMLQKEVADRLAARPGTSEYGLLSATAQLYAKVEKLFTLEPGSFSPSPKVHSTVVRLALSQKLETLHVAEQEFIEFLKVSFAQKRKTLWNNLKSQFPPEGLKRAMGKARIQPAVRAEALTLEQSAALFRALSNDAGNSKRT